MLQKLNNYWVLGIAAIILYIIIKKIINMDCEEKEKKEDFTSKIGKNIPTLISYYVGLH
jgi:hypothetical protein